jgi:integrase
MKLTQKSIGSLELPPGKTEHIEFCDDIPGFGLRLRAGKSKTTKTLVFQYKLGDKHRRVTLGPFEAIGSEQARKIASEMYAKVRLGHDPAGEKAESRAKVAETMEAALRSYLPHQKSRLKPRSYTEIERHLLSHAKPFHALQLAKIDRRAVAARLAEIATKSGSITSNRVRASLSAFFAWTIRQGLLDSNPVVGTGREQEKSRDRVLSDAELAAIWNALDDDDFGAIIKLLTLTAQRASEIAGLRWTEITGDQIVLPAERTKNAREHRIPLSAPAIAILETRSRRLDRDFIFGRRAGPFTGWGKCRAAINDRIRESTGAALPHWTPHDLRRTAATRMADLGVQPHVVEAVLNHVSGHKAGVAGIYNRATYTAEKRQALEIWASHVLTVVEGRESNIVTLRVEQ